MNLTKEQQDTWDTFQKVKNHLLTQQQYSQDHNGNCSYRGINGLSCAIGCLIPDDLYTYEMENKTFKEIYDEFPKIRHILEPLLNIQIETIYYGKITCTQSLGEELQFLHDIIDFEGWEEAFDEVEMKIKKIFIG